MWNYSTRRRKCAVDREAVGTRVHLLKEKKPDTERQCFKFLQLQKLGLKAKKMTWAVQGSLGRSMWARDGDSVVGRMA